MVAKRMTVRDQWEEGGRETVTVIDSQRILVETEPRLVCVVRLSMNFVRRIRISVRTRISWL
jgi:hypothetical protein